MSATMQPYLSIVDQVVKLAEEAGAITMEYFRGGGKVELKEDNSPVTEADLASSHHIEQGLKALTPNIPVICEETDNKQLNGEMFWLVDPLDGTRAFVEGKPEFTVNIGLVHEYASIFGVLHVPAQGATFVGGKDVPAKKIAPDGSSTDISVRTPKPDHWVVVRSSAHASPKLQEFLEPFPVGEMIGASSALKFGVVAEGKADFYPRLGPTMEWDTAAGQAIVEAAGAVMETLDGEPFRYGKPDYKNPGFVVFAKKPK